MKPIPSPSKRRLVLLKQLLCDYQEKTITSQKIESIAGWSAAVIRRDISLLDIKCGASNGYKVQELRVSLNRMLNNSQSEQRCIIVGLGRLGQVLMDSRDIQESSFKLVAGFDSNVNRTEVLRSSFPLHPTTMLNSVIKSQGISYAILTTDAEEAQDMATKLAECGIKGIVNYTPCVLTVPSSVSVENVSLLTSLETLSINSSSQKEVC